MMVGYGTRSASRKSGTSTCGSMTTSGSQKTAPASFRLHRVRTIGIALFAGLDRSTSRSAESATTMIRSFDGARLFAVDEIVPSARTSWRSPREVATFAGPCGLFFSDGQRLFSSAEDGLSVWDVNDGARIGRIDGFRPTRQHPASRELVEVSGSALHRWRY